MVGRAQPDPLGLSQSYATGQSGFPVGERFRFRGPGSYSGFWECSIGAHGNVHVTWRPKCSPNTAKTTISPPKNRYQRWY